MQSIHDRWIIWKLLMNDLPYALNAVLIDTTCSIHQRFTIDRICNTIPNKYWTDTNLYHVSINQYMCSEHVGSITCKYSLFIDSALCIHSTLLIDSVSISESHCPKQYGQSYRMHNRLCTSFDIIDYRNHLLITWSWIKTYEADIING